MTASLGGLVISWLVGIKLPGLEYNNQKVEAAFRKELVYGEDDRKNYVKPPTILELFTGIKFNYHRLFLHYGYFDLWLIMYNQSMIIVPYILMGPGLFTGAMTLGILIQTSSAFREVQSSFSLFLQNWTRITELRSIYKRLNEFEKAIKYSSFPPVGERSQGGGQYYDLWGENYRKLANEYILIVAQIESPSGVCIVETLVHIDGLDIIMVASTDLASFSGFNQGDDEYEKLVSRVTKTTLSSGKILGGPYAWKKRNGFNFLQGPSAEELLSRGVKNLLLEESSVDFH